MKKVNEQLLRIMQAIEERAELNPKGSVFVVDPELFVDCPDYEPLLDKLEQEYMAIVIKQHPNEQHLDYDQLAMIETDLGDYMRYKLTLTSSFESLLTQLSNANALQASTQSTSDPDTAQQKVAFDAKSFSLSYGNRTCIMPYRSLEYYICKLVFSSEEGSATENDVLEEYGGKETERAVYDAMGRVNKKVRESFGIDKLLKWKRSEIFVNEQYL